MTRIDWNLLARHFAEETTAEEDLRIAAWGASRRGRRLLLDLLRRIWSVRAASPDTDAAWQRVAHRTGIAGHTGGLRARLLLPLAAAAGLALLLGPPLVRRPGPARSAPAAPTVYTTAEHESAMLRLADGTVVRLGPASTLRVHARDEREVWLEGRAYFAVRSDPAHPFVAHTRAGSARVLGTRFVLDAAGDSVRVSVVEGRVALSAGGEVVEVGAGRASDGAFGLPPTAAKPIDVADAAAWIGDVLIFQDTGLGQVASEIERVYGIRVIVEDSTLESRTVSAVFNEQPLGRVVSTVCRVIEARCSTSGDTVRIRS